MDDSQHLCPYSIFVIVIQLRYLNALSAPPHHREMMILSTDQQTHVG